MQTVAADPVIDIMDHEELLFLYQDYVAECVEVSTTASPSRPLSFDDWHKSQFMSRTESHTVVITVTLTWETASRGYLCGSDSREYRLLVPASMLAESGGIVDDIGLKRIAKKFATKANRRLPSVVYRGEHIYQWTGD